MSTSGFTIPIRFSIPIPDSQALDSRFPIPNFSNSIFDSRFRFPGRRFRLIQGPRQKTGRFRFYFLRKMHYTVQTAIRGLSDPLPDSNCKQHKDFLEIVVDNSTRWNSLYDCIERFLFLRKTIEATLDAEDLSGIDWDKLLEIAQILKPLKVSILKFNFK